MAPTKHYALQVSSPRDEPSGNAFCKLRRKSVKIARLDEGRHHPSARPRRKGRTGRPPPAFAALGLRTVAPAPSSMPCHRPLRPADLDSGGRESHQAHVCGSDDVSNFVTNQEEQEGNRGRIKGIWQQNRIKNWRYIYIYRERERSIEQRLFEYNLLHNT
jgi:hypothetical protein